MKMKSIPKIYFITGNKGKAMEVQQSLPSVIIADLKNLPEIQSLEIEEVIQEKLKAAILTYGAKDIILIEDTGLYLHSLNNFPGPLIKHFLISVGLGKIYVICRRSKDLTAHATTAFGLYDPIKDKTLFFSATIQGKITSPKGNSGFGWDPVFKPKGSKYTYAEMNPIQKMKFSMRVKAINKAIKYLRKNHYL